MPVVTRTDAYALCLQKKEQEIGENIKLLSRSNELFEQMESMAPVLHVEESISGSLGPEFTKIFPAERASVHRMFYDKNLNFYYAPQPEELSIFRDYLHHHKPTFVSEVLIVSGLIGLIGAVVGTMAAWMFGIAGVLFFIGCFIMSTGLTLLTYCSRRKMLGRIFTPTAEYLQAPILETDESNAQKLYNTIKHARNELFERYTKLQSSLQ